MNVCLFCNEPEHNAPPDTDYVCSSCVITLLNASQDSLKAGLARAEEVGAIRRATAIKMFIEVYKEPVNVKRVAKKKNFGFKRREPKRFAPGRIGLKEG